MFNNGTPVDVTVFAQGGHIQIVGVQTDTALIPAPHITVTDENEREHVVFLGVGVLIVRADRPITPAEHPALR